MPRGNAVRGSRPPPGSGSRDDDDEASPPRRLEINARGTALSLETLRAEARKCVLVCSNCHAEVEDGKSSIPAGTLDRRSSNIQAIRGSSMAEESAFNR